MMGDVGAAFFFLARLKFHVLMLEIERWFSYFLFVVSKILKSYHAAAMIIVLSR
jgi:hypothetical protein